MRLPKVFCPKYNVNSLTKTTDVKMKLFAEFWLILLQFLCCIAMPQQNDYDFYYDYEDISATSNSDYEEDEGDEAKKSKFSVLFFYFSNFK